ncbi:hypothetical protein JCM10213_005994 [Rhodosporidiobolus nylandii]
MPPRDLLWGLILSTFKFEYSGADEYKEEIWNAVRGRDVGPELRDFFNERDELRQDWLIVSLRTFAEALELYFKRGRTEEESKSALRWEYRPKAETFGEIWLYGRMWVDFVRENRRPRIPLPLATDLSGIFLRELRLPGGEDSNFEAWRLRLYGEVVMEYREPSFALDSVVAKRRWSQNRHEFLNAPKSGPLIALLKKPLEMHDHHVPAPTGTFYDPTKMNSLRKPEISRRYAAANFPELGKEGWEAMQRPF